MKQLLILSALVLSTAFCSNLFGQTAPVVSGDKDLRDTDVKRRSVDMERVERDAKKDEKSRKTEAAKNEDKLAAKFAEIKTDFEQMQLSQDAIIKAYQTGGKIDYALIGKSALEINKSAARLDSNLFPAPEADKNNAVKREAANDETENKPKPAKGVRDLIVEMDNAIGSFANSPMFQNLRTVDREVAAKAKLDLGKIIELSALLDAEARKMETSPK